MSHLVLVDGNNLGFAGMANPKLSAGEANTQATFTVIKKIRKLYFDNPDALIMVLWDGKSWRKDLFKEYKENRERTEQQVAERKAYYAQKESLIDGLHYLGVVQSFASNMEADDLAQIYSSKWKGDKVTLISGDKDWLQLVDERTTWVDPILDRQCTNANFQTFTGFKNVQQFLEAKYILGDAGDNVKGLYKVGPRTLERIFQVWDSVYDYINDEEKHEKWQEYHGKSIPAALDIHPHDIYDIMCKNESLMSLSTVSRPEPINLRKLQGPLNEEAFKNFCYANAFLSFTRDFDKFIRPFKENKFVSKERI